MAAAAIAGLIATLALPGGLRNELVERVKAATGLTDPYSEDVEGISESYGFCYSGDGGSDIAVESDLIGACLKKGTLEPGTTAADYKIYSSGGYAYVIVEDRMEKRDDRYYLVNEDGSSDGPYRLVGDRITDVKTVDMLMGAYSTDWINGLPSQCIPDVTEATAALHRYASEIGFDRNRITVDDRTGQEDLSRGPCLEAHYSGDDGPGFVMFGSKPIAEGDPELEAFIGDLRATFYDTCVPAERAMETFEQVRVRNLFRSSELVVQEVPMHAGSDIKSGGECAIPTLTIGGSLTYTLYVP